MGRVPITTMILTGMVMMAASQGLVAHTPAESAAASAQAQSPDTREPSSERPVTAAGPLSPLTLEQYRAKLKARGLVLDPESHERRLLGNVVAPSTPGGA